MRGLSTMLLRVDLDPNRGASQFPRLRKPLSRNQGASRGLGGREAGLGRGLEADVGLGAGEDPGAGEEGLEAGAGETGGQGTAQGVFNLLQTMKKDTGFMWQI